MGVPAFFRWLTLRYPKIVIEALENLDIGIDINKIMKDNLGENNIMPSIDNLYFDMNGIIHPCAHPEDRDAPSSISEMFNSIFNYCDKLIRIIKPKKLIFMAIDGVAPRAKMNQQRSRRFRAAIDAEQKERITKKIEKEWKSKGLPTDFLDIKNKTKFKFDSNYITPGTEFLEECSIALKLYIKSKINNDPLWKNVNVIFSDSSVPGEGEHKILDFIRNQRTLDSYDPNTSHCIYGADADLIMLSLIMHEPNFYVIRESLNEKYYLICEKCGKHGHNSEECKNFTSKFNRHNSTKAQIAQFNKEKIDQTEFSLLKIGILREYLELEFKDLINLKYDLELIIDDFVFLCFLVGNDFLPNLPSLKIREGGIDALIYLYKKIRPEMKNYLTNGKGQLNLIECEMLFEKLSLIEDEFFKKEIENKNHEEQFKKNKNISSKNNKNSVLNTFRNIPKIRKNSNNKNQKDLVEYNENKFNQIIKEEIYEENNKKIEDYVDKIKLGKKGWKDRYYMEKFHISSKSNNKSIMDLKEKIKQYYIEGLCWVFEYYYNGCISWSWFYPFHYAPFASDLTKLKDININFELGKPFMPFEQLLSVLPPYSAGALPKCFQKLMTEPLSPIADFYPINIKLDINNQPYTWMGVNLLPFIDAERIQRVVDIILNENKKLLNKKEMNLNKIGDNILISKDQDIFNNFNGELSKYPDIISYDNFLKEYNFIKDIQVDKVKQDKSENYIFKKIINNKTHCSNILNGVKKPKKSIIEYNIDVYSKNKFKGKQAIEIVQKILGYMDDDVEDYIMTETFGGNSYNNNRGISYEPKKMFLFKKKRFRENSENTRNVQPHYYRKRNNNFKNQDYKDNNSRKKYSNRNKSNSINYYNRDNRSRSRYKSRDNSNKYNNNSRSRFNENNEKRYKKMEDSRTKKKYYNTRYRK